MRGWRATKRQLAFNETRTDIYQSKSRCNSLLLNGICGLRLDLGSHIIEPTYYGIVHFSLYPSHDVHLSIYLSRAITFIIIGMRNAHVDKESPSEKRSRIN